MKFLITIVFAEAVFDNILARVIEWPEDEEALSTEAVEAISSLLTLDPNERPGFEEVKVKLFIIHFQAAIHELKNWRIGFKIWKDISTATFRLSTVLNQGSFKMFGILSKKASVMNF